ncbi:GH25 family lysozyme [Parasporobacterium paucivorans]|uniref:Glycosyl hydrolases family 25 n=1 Tax=Parasporobacterium paucivorans DSM 15970 TaxID=1122934 RepID=A0A1M6J105_9FIRM|nr:GH25 family lysozyme [Parasporobacterium paucivorans]SHJ40414.1 Glycosyl hydrolases family 25 [Parasporobacterium paucivorans DSM 15970]
MRKKIFISAAGLLALIVIITAIVLASGKTDKNDTAGTTLANNEETSGTESGDSTSSQEESTDTLDGGEDPQPVAAGGNVGVEVSAANLGASNNDYSVSGITYGIDVSKWQGKIDWTAVKKAGIEFAMIRIGYRTDGNGTICEDAYAKYNLQQAAKAGIKTGVYFFSTAVSTEEAVEEAAWVTDLIGTYKITYPVVYNCEDFTASDSRMHGMTNAERTDNALAFLEYVKNKGYIPMFYAGGSELTGSASWDTQRIASGYKIWVAQYPGTAYSSGMTSSYSGDHAMWQYTNKGIVNGISGYVDMNVAYFGFSSDAEAKIAGGASEVTAPTAQTTVYDPYTAVNEQVTAKSETNLRTSPNSADSGTVVYTLKNGEFIQRVAIGTNGWSKVIYGGQTLYAVSSLLTTSAEPAATQQTPTETQVLDPFTGYNVTEVNEQVTAKEEVNLRTLPEAGGNSVVVYTLKNGEFVTRTAYAGDGLTTGWSRVTYGGQTLYALSSYLTK